MPGGDLHLFYLPQLKSRLYIVCIGMLNKKESFVPMCNSKIYAVAAEDSNGQREEQSYLIIK
jgi:hypothetical protein